MSSTVPTFPQPLEPELLSPREASRSRLMAFLGAATILVSVLYAPWSTTGPILCPLRLVTGLPCPGCGLTRSFCAMTRGHFGEAFGYHIFGPFLFVAVLIGTPMLAYEGITHRPIKLLERALFSKRIASFAAVALFGYHAVRLVVMGWNGDLSAGLHGSINGVILHHLFHWPN